MSASKFRADFYASVEKISISLVDFNRVHSGRMNLFLTYLSDSFLAPTEEFPDRADFEDGETGSDVVNRLGSS